MMTLKIKTNPTANVLRLACLLYAVVSLAASRAADTNLPFASEIAAFRAEDAARPAAPGATLFTGSSSIRMWRTLSNDFSGHAVINRGFGGSQISDVLLNFDDLIPPSKPGAIVFYCGGNDIHGGKSPATVLADFARFFDRARQAAPNARIYYISIAANPARFAELEKVREANQSIEEFCRRHPAEATFIDTFPLMLQPDGTPRPELFGPDRLHMSPEGYAIWTRAVRKAVFGED
jgi:lysophospholipase L1-like esterase